MTIISDLTAETVAAATDEFAGVKGSADAKAYSFALMGGLEIDDTYNSATDHADATLTAGGKLHRINLGTLGSEVVIKLPVAANIQTGEMVGFYVTTTNSTAGRELSIKTGAALDLINEVDHSTNEHTRIWQAGEYIVYQCLDGATADWRVASDGRIPCRTHIDLGTDSASTESAATWTDIDMASGTAQSDVGGIADIANDRVNIRRAGDYTINVSGRPATAPTDQTYWGVGWHTATGNGITKQTTVNIAKTDVGTTVMHSTHAYPLAVSSTVYAKFRSEEGSKGLKALAQLAYVSVMEVF